AGQIEALQELHHEKRAAALVRSEVEEPHGVRIGQAGERNGLAFEAGGVRRALEILVHQQLERHPPFERQLYRLIHRAHAALPEQALDTIAPSDDIPWTYHAVRHAALPPPPRG